MIAALRALARDKAVLIAGAILMASLATGWGVYSGQRKVLMLVLGFTAVVLLRRWAFTDFYFVTITCALLSHVPQPFIHDEFDRYKWQALFLMAGISVIVALTRIASPPWPRAIHVVALALVVLGAQSIGWSLDPWHSLQKAGVFTLTLMVAFIGAWCAAVNLRSLRRILDVHVHWLWLVFPASFLAPFLPYFSAFDGAGRFRGLYQNPNALGFWASTSLPFVFATWLTDERRRMRRAALVLLVSGFGCVVLAGSRGGFVGAMIGIGCYCVMRWPRRTLQAGFALGVVLAFLLAYEVEFGGLSERLEYAVRPDTLTNLSDRTLSWKFGLLIAAQRPWLGHGFGLGDRLFPLYGFEQFFGHFAPTVHNSYLDTYMNIGLVGVALLVGMQVLAGVAGLQTWWHDRSGRTGLLALGLLATFVGGSAHGAIETIFMSPGTPWALPYWVTAVLLVRMRVLQKQGARWDPPAQPAGPQPVAAETPAPTHARPGS